MADTLRAQLSAGDKRARVVDDAVSVLEAEIQDKGGLGGLAIKGAFAILRGTRPGFVRHVVDKLFDDFLDAFEAPYADSIAQGLPPGGLVVARKAEVASRLLRAADDRVRQADNLALQKTYDKLRPTAQKHVEEAAPRLAALIDRHASAH